MKLNTADALLLYSATQARKTFATGRISGLLDGRQDNEVPSRYYESALKVLQDARAVLARNPDSSSSVISSFDRLIAKFKAAR
jgi:hypothetical protein